MVSRSGRQYSVIPCTKRAVFESSLPALQGVSLVVTSVLSNFICDACTDPSHIVDAANAELQRHVTSLFQLLGRHPEMNVVIVPPLPRLVPDWFNSYLPCFTTYLVSAVSRCQSSRLQVMAPFVALPSSFDSDGVHLNSASGLCFIQFLINGLDQILPSTPAGQPQSASMMPSSSSVTTATHDGTSSASTAPFTSSSVGAQGASFANVVQTSSSSSSSSMLSQAVTSLTVMTGNLRSEVVTRRLQDNLIFARLKEDQDYALNKNREDRFTVTGLRLSQAPPQDALERKTFFKELLAELILEACPDLDPPPRVLDVFVNMRYGRGAPFIEGRLDSAASSSAFRIAAAKLAKVENSRFETIFVANSVTLTTRVRIEILKAVAKLLTTETEVAYVQSFTSRPMLHYQTREGARHQLPDANRSYSFVEAVGRWGDRLTTVMLLPAYKRARPAFIGCLEQYFVVLKESEPREDPSGFEQLFGSAPNNTPLGVPPYFSRGSRWPGSFRGTRGMPGSSRGFAGFVRSDRGNLRKRPAPVDSHQTPSKRKENFSAGTEAITNDVVIDSEPEVIPESQDML